MLISAPLRAYDYTGSLVAMLNKNSTAIKQIQMGIYEIGHFSFEYSLSFELTTEQTYPQFGDARNCYGVCDNHQQILKLFPELEQDPDRKFAVSLTPVVKANQSETDGWRWHKWGPYIGTHTITTEYLYDEPDIEQIYVYHIYEIPSCLGK